MTITSKNQCENAAFAMALPQDGEIPIVFSAPHGGRAYDPDDLARLRQPDRARLALEDRYIDVLARAIATRSGCAWIVAKTPRAIIDLNRSPEDVDWSMISDGEARLPARNTNHRSAKGLGLVPRRIAGLGELWRNTITEADLKRRVRDFHRPYHEALHDMLRQVHHKFGMVLLIDLHSMPPLRNTPTAGAPIEFVIGDRYGKSCARSIVDGSFGFFAKEGRPAAYNQPYAGGYVLDRHAEPDAGFHALQLEICRSTYLDMRLVGLSPRHHSIIRMLARWTRDIGMVVQQLDVGSRYDIAAE